MCLYPRVILNKKYVSNNKNGGDVPLVRDTRVLYVPVGCGKCMECKKQKARGWQVRLLEDLRQHKNGKFVTMTFSDQWIKKIVEGYTLENGQQVEGIKNLEGYDLDNAIATRATRLFLERWRKEYGKSLRHWFVTELGHENTENVHLHGIVWTDKPLSEVERIWQHGWVWKGKKVRGRTINYVNEQTVNYITKYVHKVDQDHKEYNSKVLTSPGIGANYTKRIDARNNAYVGARTQETYRTRTGHHIAMPTYWRNKIYTDLEREELWLNRLNKEERWVNGERISIKNGEQQYYKALDWHRRLNKELGYGTSEKNWDRIEYEKERRQLMINARIKRGDKNNDGDA